MEGVLLSVRPILIGLPLLVIVCVAQCYMMGVSVNEFLYAFPAWALVAYIILVLLVINGIYMLELRSGAISPPLVQEKGKYTVITGASSGIGYETAKAFAERGKI